jgi:hypothetical protein
MEGETAIVSSADLDHKNDSSSPFNSNYPQQQSRVQSTNIRPNTNASSSLRGPSTAERHTLPEIPRNPLTATVAHVVSRELG